MCIERQTTKTAIVGITVKPMSVSVPRVHKSERSLEDNFVKIMQYPMVFVNC